MKVGIRVKRCVLQSSGIKVRAHRSDRETGSWANPSRSKIKQGYETVHLVNVPGRSLNFSRKAVSR